MTKLGGLDKGGGQLRPICVSTIWVKLISYLILPPAREHLDPHLREVVSLGSAPHRGGGSAVLMHQSTLSPVPGTRGCLVGLQKGFLRPPLSDVLGGCF